MTAGNASFDFHLHSCWSYDATCPVETYFSMAAEKGVSHIAITEHHHMDSIQDVQDAAKKYPMVNYIPAAELTVHSPAGTFDMVCLGMPIEPTTELKTVFDAYHRWQRDFGDAFSSYLTKRSFPYSREERKMLLERYRPARTIAHQGITHVQFDLQRDYLINEKQLFSDAGALSTALKDADSELPHYPEYDLVIPAVKKAGALVFIAHPHGYFNQKDLRRMDELRELLDFDGIECAHTGIPGELTPFYRQYCLEHGLLSTAGSDTHSSPYCRYNFCSKCTFANHIGQWRYAKEILERITAFHA